VVNDFPNDNALRAASRALRCQCALRIADFALDMRLFGTAIRSMCVDRNYTSSIETFSRFVYQLFFARQ
jgi:hypothetical protein